MAVQQKENTLYSNYISVTSKYLKMDFFSNIPTHMVRFGTTFTIFLPTITVKAIHVLVLSLLTQLNVFPCTSWNHTSISPSMLHSNAPMNHSFVLEVQGLSIHLSSLFPISSYLFQLVFSYNPTWLAKQ